MAEPASRENLKQYALRALGKPVIEINVDDDQLEDRMDEALQYFSQYHFDGVKRTYLKYEYTQADHDRILQDTPESISKTYGDSNKEDVKKGQNFYSEHLQDQQQNPHTPTVLQSLGLPEEDITKFCTNNLFPKI